jgi:hypothetical protein
MHALLPSDPGGTGTPGHSASAMLPSACGTASAPTISEFRGSITRPTSSPSTLRSGGYPNATQDSLPGGGQPYPSGTRPAGSVRKVSETTHLMSSLPPSPSFARRTPRSSLEGELPTKLRKVLPAPLMAPLRNSIVPMDVALSDPHTMSSSSRCSRPTHEMETT